jgi:hypothetical protein
LSNGSKIRIPYGMGTSQDNLSKEDLIKVISSRDQALVDQQRIVDPPTQDSTQKDEWISALSHERDTLTQERNYLKAHVEMLLRM